MRRDRWSRRSFILALGAVVLAAVVLVPRIPALAGYRYVGVVEAAPADAPLGIVTALIVSNSAAETGAIWAGMAATLWENPVSFDDPPTVDYEREILAFATLFSSSSCKPSLGGVDIRDGAATIRVDHSSGFGGCTADAVPYTFLVAVARDRISVDPPQVHMLPTPRPAPR